MTELPGQPRKSGVLVVEEEKGIRGLLDHTLRLEGLEVWSAATGPEALELLHNHTEEIAAAVVDVGMAGWDGPLTVHALQECCPGLCFCFMTGGSSRYSEEELLGLGAAAVFFKPFSPAEVAQTLLALVAAGNRRAAPRLPGNSLQVSVFRLDAHGDIWEGQVQNRSPGGIGLLLPEPVAVGSLLRVRPPAAAPEEPELDVVVRHAGRKNHGWLVGSQVLSGPAAGVEMKA